MRDLSQLIQLLQQADFLKEQRSAAEELQRKYAENEVILSVIGQFKRGKSSLINNLLQEPLLPVSIVPLTTAVTEIRYGREFRAQVCYTDGIEQDIERSGIASYISEENNPGNHKHVVSVKIWTPSHPWGEGSVLVDTPGVGSIHKHNTDSSYSYLEHSDVILFLLAVDSPVSAAERDFLLEAKQYAAKFYFVVNKADTVSEADLQKFMAFSRQVIGASLGQEIKIRAVSAKTGQGMDELAAGLREGMCAAHNSLLAASLDRKADIIGRQAQAKIQLCLRAAYLPGNELKQTLSLIKQNQERLDHFHEELDLLARHRSEALVETIKQHLEKQSADLKSRIIERAQLLYEELGSLPVKKFEQEFQGQLDAFIRQQLDELHVGGLTELKTGYAGIVASLNSKALEAARFIAHLAQDQFGQEYPVAESSFQVSERSDFFLRIGGDQPFMLDVEMLTCFLPRRLANKRFFRRSLQQALLDVERNRNNMLYNYRYKMQESLRVLCRVLTEKIVGMGEELRILTEHICQSLQTAENERQAEERRLQKILQALQAAEE